MYFVILVTSWIAGTACTPVSRCIWRTFGLSILSIFGSTFACKTKRLMRLRYGFTHIYSKVTSSYVHIYHEHVILGVHIDLQGQYWSYWWKGEKKKTKKNMCLVTSYIYCCMNSSRINQYFSDFRPMIFCLSKTKVKGKL